LLRPIEDQELLLDENGPGDYRADAARTQESGTGTEDVAEKDDEIAHLGILAKMANMRNCPAN
jgi:hypothetical protein